MLAEICMHYSAWTIVWLAYLSEAVQGQAGLSTETASPTTTPTSQTLPPGVTIGWISGNADSPITCPPLWFATRSTTPSAPWGCCNTLEFCPGYYSTCVAWQASSPVLSSCNTCPSVLSCSEGNPSCIRFLLATGSDDRNPAVSYGCLPSASDVLVSASSGAFAIRTFDFTSVPSSTTASPGSTLSSPVSSPTGSPGDYSESGKGSGGSTARILKIVIPIVVVLALILCALFLWKRRRQNKRSRVSKPTGRPSAGSDTNGIDLHNLSDGSAGPVLRRSDASDDGSSKRRDFKIAIICAIEKESDSVLQVMDDRYNGCGKHANDENAYTAGTIANCKVVLVHLAGTGQTSAGISAGSLKLSFPNIELALVVGVCGGVPITRNNEQIFLGDLVISTSTVTGDFGRQFPKDFQRYETVRNPSRRLHGFLHKISNETYRRSIQADVAENIQDIRNRRSAYHAEGAASKDPPIDELFEASYLHKHRSQEGQYACQECDAQPDGTCKSAFERSCAELGCDRTRIVHRVNRDRRRDEQNQLKPEVHFGRIGSGNTLMRSGEHRDHIAWLENLIAFEMEGAAVDRVCDTLIVKAVCDYADSHKNKSWQPYAADVAAAGVKALLSIWP